MPARLVEDHFDEAMGALLDGRRAALFDASNLLQESIRLRAPGQGRLKESIREMGSTTDTVRVGTRDYIALFVEHGTGLFGARHHLIHPKRKKALAGGLEATRAWERGMPANPFFRRGITAAKPDLPRVVGDAFKLALRAALPKK
jgi:hypothetical protein